LGGRHYLHLDPPGLALSRRGDGSVLTACRWLVDEPLDEPAPGGRCLAHGSRCAAKKLSTTALWFIDAASGGHIWAERYDGNMENIFDFQDDIREQIVAALQVSLTPTDEALSERKPTNDVEAYDLFLKGRANIHFYTPERMLEAIKYLDAAIEIDPNFADAYGFLSYCYFYGRIVMWPEFDDNFDRAEAMAEKGVALDNTSAIAVTNLGLVQTWLRRYDQAVANLEKAVALDPNSSQVFATFGQALNYIGKPEKALEMIQKALSFETSAPAVWEFQLGHSHLLLRQYDEALARFHRTVERAPNVTPPYLYLACTYAELGQIDDAKKMIKSAL
jgi:tetratricopeptide (TPR) repeat protein